MPPKGKKGKKERGIALDPLPGPELLRPVFRYSEDDVIQFGQNVGNFRPPQAEDEPPDEKSSLGDIPAELIFDLEEQPSVDALNAFTLAEENSDDVESLSSATENLDEAVASDLSIDSAQTESESTSSDSDNELLGASTRRLLSEKPENDHTVSRFGGMHFKPASEITQSKEDWITKTFVDILNDDTTKTSLSQLTVDDLLETNLDFENLGPDVMAKLKKMAERSSSPGSVGQRSNDFETASSSAASSVGNLYQDKVQLPPAPPLEEEINKDKKSKPKPEKDANKTDEPLALPQKTKPKAYHRKYPAERYREDLRTTPLQNPYFTQNELFMTNSQQDKWLVESAEDLAFMEYRREQVLGKQPVPVGVADYAMELIAETQAIKALNSINVNSAQSPGRPPLSAGYVNGQPHQVDQPKNPLVPTKVNQIEDPNDEDTSSNEEEPSRNTTADNLKKQAVQAFEKSVKTSIAMGLRKETVFKDPYKVKLPVHEDDLYNYYESGRSSSEWESADEEFSKTYNKGKENGFTKEKPAKLKKSKSSPIDDLYALAHDLHMPPSELRRELKLQWSELYLEENSSNQGWKSMEAVLEYEKTPAYYQVQIHNLEHQIELKRKQWIELELDHHELSTKSRFELSDLDQFINFLLDQNDYEITRAAILKNKFQQLKGQLDEIVVHNTVTINWLEGEREKLKKLCQERKVDLQYKIYTLRENVDKQRRMEAEIALLKRQAIREKNLYTSRLSKLILNTAKLRNKLFRNYERKLAQVFLEYQRALMLSMNDNLQEACCEHVTSCQKAREFSKKAIRSIKAFQHTNDQANRLQHETALQTQLLTVSLQEGNIRDKEWAYTAKLAHKKDCVLELLDTTISTDEHSLLKHQKLVKLRKKNAIFDNLRSALRKEIEKIQQNMETETTSGQQLNGQLDKLRRTLERYQNYQQENSTGLHRRDLIEPFEDGFVKFLHYAQTIKELATPALGWRPSSVVTNFGAEPLKSPRSIIKRSRKQP
ncbi:uncharacterized protein LOC129590161 [Paramacrobiotus metropolitanus]|uniref:uncharacterized protein LOC129590161 n=1 Tax=Paramacrobiotus metropolitanus TaxID=2943436 RepID=UPI00244584EF|nr:uncharacterized protein LOC129590161 [Paramacrobiotus metropolitanus]